MIVLGEEGDKYLRLAELELKYPEFLHGLANGAEAQAAESNTQPRPPKHSKGPKLSATPERICHALCGHAPDPSKVPPFEFALLCAIAKTREEGILQGPLTQITKQDKRSVPQRTDRLRDKGYIDKRNVYLANGQKTSRLTLRRFVQQEKKKAPAPLTLKDVAQQIFSVCDKDDYTSLADLAIKLDLRDDLRKSVLSSVANQLVRRGCLKIVEAANGSEQETNICIHIVREPTDSDCERHDVDDVDLDLSLEQVVATAAVESIHSVSDDIQDDLYEQDRNSNDVKQESSQKVPQWNPDRVLPNVIYDYAVNIGREGITNNSTRREITGTTVRRSVEAILTRLSHSSLRSQPASARNLALIRTREVDDAIPRYVHRTLPAFQSMVQADQAQWASVSGGMNLVKELETNIPPIIDEFGFLRQQQATPQLQNGELDLEAAMSSVGAGGIYTRAGEPTLLESADGSFYIGAQAAGVGNPSTKVETSKSVPIEKPAKQKMPATASLRVAKPRKFAHGTAEFWRNMMILKKEELQPGSTKGNGKLGVTKDPEVLKWHDSRPKGFDACIVQSIENNVPLPSSPTDVNQSWVDKVQSYLSRCTSGLHVTPSGRIAPGKGQRARLITIRSTRLEEVDFSDFKQPAKVLFASSSAAHTTRAYNLDPWVNTEPWVLQWRIKQLTESDLDQTRPALGCGSISYPEAEKELLRSKVSSTSATSKKRKRATAVAKLAQNGDKEAMTSDAGSPPSKIRKLSGPPSIKKAKQGKGNHTLQQRSEAQHSIESDLCSPATVLQTNSTPESNGTETSTSEIPLQVRMENAETATAVGESDNMPSNVTAHTIEPLKNNEIPLTFAPFQKSSASAENGVDATMDQPTSQNLQIDVVKNLAVIGVDDEMDDEHASAISDNELYQPETPTVRTSRPKPKPRVLKPRQSNAIYQKLIVELVNLCAGVVPHSLSILKRAVKTKAIEAGLDQPSVKILRNVINNVTRSGRLKIMKIAFQSGGFNRMKEILALPETQVLDKKFLAMQQKIIALPYDEDYMPPELEQEGSRTPSKMPRQDLLEELDEDFGTPKRSRNGSIVETPPAPATPVSSSRPQRQTKTKKRRSSLVPSISEEAGSASVPDTLSLNNGFLTLKVPRIANIKTSASFTSHYFELPVQPVPLRFDAIASEAASQTAQPTPASQRRSGVGIPRTSTFKPGQGIQWRTPKNLALPKSLKAILSHSCVEGERGLRDADGVQIFEDKVSAMEAGFMHSIYHVGTWEIENWDDLQPQKPAEWNFINYLVPKNQFEYVPLQRDAHFLLVRYTGTCEDEIAEYEEDLPAAESWDVFAAVSSKSRAKQKRVEAQAEKQKKKRRVEDVDFDDTDSGFAASEDEAVAASRRKSKTEPRAKKRKIEDDKRKGKRNGIITRGIGMRNLSKEEAHRILTAFVVVKVLAGGLDRYLDFELVGRLLPEETDVTIQERFKVLTHHYNNDMDAYTADFQTKYLDALVEERVPTVDYDDLDSTDWHGIHDWAVQNINAEIKVDEPMEMPPNREELLALNDVEVPELKPARMLFNQNLNFSHTMKEDAWTATITGVDTYLPRVTHALEPTFPAEDDEHDIGLARARSWILAAALTSASTFHPRRTKEKLSLLASHKNDLESLIDSTIKKLTTDKVLVKSSSVDAVTNMDGQTYSGTHGWKISTKFFDKFETNRVITPTMLRDAARYKLETLDAIFAVGKTVTFSKHPNIKDGSMVAVLNLLAQGMVVIKPGHDVPASRYGLDHEESGYKTRSMDRDVMGFSTILEPVPGYVYGDPVSKSHAVPRGGLDQGDFMGLIPMWFDINGSFLPQIWEMALGALVGIVSSRPGVSTVEVVRMLNWVMSKHDLELVLEYLLICNTICKKGTGWETMDWWWLSVGCGHGHERGVQWECRQ